MYPVVLFLYFAIGWLLYLYPPFIKGVQGTTNHAMEKTTGLYPAKRIKIDLEMLRQSIDLTANLHRRGSDQKVHPAFELVLQEWGG